MVVDLEAEGAGAAGHSLADAAHADDAEALSADAMAEHPGRRPAGPGFSFGQDRCAFDQPARHGQDQRHGHVGGVFSQNLRRVGDGDAAGMRRLDVDIVDAVAEIGDQAELAVGVVDDVGGDLVGDGRNQHVGGARGFGDLLGRHRRVVEIDPRVEQFAHPGLDRIRQLARHDDEGFFFTDMSCSSGVASRLCRQRPAVQASLTRLFDTAPAASSPAFLRALPDTSTRKIGANWLFRCPSSLAEGRAKTRTTGLASGTPAGGGKEGTRQGLDFGVRARLQPALDRRGVNGVGAFLCGDGACLRLVERLGQPPALGEGQYTADRQRPAGAALRQPASRIT